MKFISQKSSTLVWRFIWHMSGFLPQNANIRSFVFSKKFVVHTAFLCLMVSVAWHGQRLSIIDKNYLLYSVVSGEEVREGPIDPSAYAQTTGPGMGGARLSAVDGSDSSFSSITFDDPEVSFSQTLGGNAVVAPLEPLVEESTEEESTEEKKSEEPKKVTKPQVYTVQSGDTIAGIASKFSIDVNTILWANGLSSNDVIKVGDHVTILPVSGVLHTVKSGDTLSGIASQYKTKAAEVIAYNNLGANATLSIGQRIIVPGGSIAPRPTPRVVSQNTQLAARTPSGPTPPPAAPAAGGFAWPTTTRNISQYFRWGHTGLDIPNRSLPPVYAATSGTVEFAGWLGAYGNLIIINHGNGMQTYYAHLNKFYVGKGQQVGKGAAIGQMGSTGRSTGPHVHFEVRKNGSPINPMSMY